jgi:homoserine O-succinyltransferase
VDIDLLYTSSYSSRHTSPEYLDSFYTTFDQIKDQRYDGMIITGAPVENYDFEDVEYWPELQEIMDWTKTHVYSTLHICWGAYAGLYHHFGIPKHNTPNKVFGVFPHLVLDNTLPLFRGFDDVFYAPHSRNTEVYEADIRACEELELLAVSPEVGVFACSTPDKRQIFVCGHLEYDADTLSTEYFRDVKKGLDIAVPEHYFPNDDPSQTPMVTWRSAGQLFYTNWLDYYVYQATPYDLRDL